MMSNIVVNQSNDNVDIVCKYLREIIEQKDDFIGKPCKDFMFEDTDQITFFPVRFPNLKKLWYDILSTFWVVSEVDMSEDKKHWDTKLNDNERYFLKHVLGFFAASDHFVNANISTNILSYFKDPVTIAIGYSQGSIECIHQEMYSILIDTFITDINERDKIFNAVGNMECIARKANWAKKWIDCDKTIIHKIVAFVVVEGIFFSGSFCAIHWLKDRNILPGLSKSNLFISRDEGLHVQIAIEYINTATNRLKQEIIYEIFDEAIELEDHFITQAMPCSMLGMNINSMRNYIRYLADRLLISMKYEPKYNTPIGFDFMGKLGVFSKINFFERRANEYVKGTNNDRSFKVITNERF
jgi:ribonucleotide reductase beta subunit family protein with ferritin-like domain